MLIKSESSAILRQVEVVESQSSDAWETWSAGAKTRDIIYNPLYQ